MTAYTENNLLKRSDGEGISVCPGPNMAYFSKKSTLHEMIDHIYGRGNVLNDLERPNMFIKELEMYINYLKKELNESLNSLNGKKIKYFEGFKTNLFSGITYYQDLIKEMKEETETFQVKFKNELNQFKETVKNIKLPTLEDCL